MPVIYALIIYLWIAIFLHLCTCAVSFSVEYFAYHLQWIYPSVIFFCRTFRLVSFPINLFWCRFFLENISPSSFAINLLLDPLKNRSYFTIPFVVVPLWTGSYVTAFTMLKWSICRVFEVHLIILCHFNCRNFIFRLT